MTEAEWLACDDPVLMLEYLRGSPKGEDAVTSRGSRWRMDAEATKGDDRRFRLFACACCRRIWGHIPEECNREAVVAVEDFLDGRSSAETVEAALAASSSVEWLEDGSGRRPEPGYWAVKYLGRGFYKMTAAASALLVASQVLFMADEEYGREARSEFDSCYYVAAGVFLRPFVWPTPVPPAARSERAAQAALLRCIFGNPFRPASLDAAGPTPDVMSLAAAAYEERALPSGELDHHRLAVLADALEEAGAHPDVLGHLRGPGPHVRGCRALDLIRGEE